MNSPHKFLSRRLVALSLALLFSIGSLVVPAQQNVAHAAGNSSQVQFNAGNGRYLYSLRICGYNQNNNYVCWSGNINQQQYVTVNGWWWKLDRGIRFDFTLNYYGNRSCYVQRSNWGNPTWLYVRYDGGGVCSIG